MCWRRLACFDDVVGEAAVAKGTFYLHFDGLAELQGPVADELAHELISSSSLPGWPPRTLSSASLRAAERSSARPCANPPRGALVARGAHRCRTLRLVAW